MKRIKFYFTEYQLIRFRAMADAMFELEVGYANFILTLIDVCDAWEVPIDVTADAREDDEFKAIELLKVAGYSEFKDQLIKLEQ